MLAINCSSEINTYEIFFKKTEFWNFKPQVAYIGLLNKLSYFVSSLSTGFRLLK